MIEINTMVILFILGCVACFVAIRERKLRLQAESLNDHNENMLNCLHKSIKKLEIENSLLIEKLSENGIISPDFEETVRVLNLLNTIDIPLDELS